MKKLMMFICLITLGLGVFGQATPSDQVRVANATTAFGVNIPIGTTVYDIGADKFYVCKAASVSTLTLTTGAANFTELATGSMHAAVTIPTLTAHGLHLSTQAISMDTATASQTGTLSSADWTTFNNKLSAEVDGSITNEGVLTVVDGTNTADIKSNTSMAKRVRFSGSGGVTIEGADSTITLFSRSAIVEDFEQAADSIADNRCYFQLSQTPTAGTISVHLNGVNLKPTTQYTIVTNKLRIGCGVYKYDQVNISYSY